MLLHRQSPFYARQVIDLDRSILGGIGGDADGSLVEPGRPTPMSAPPTRRPSLRCLSAGVQTAEPKCSAPYGILLGINPKRWGKLT